MKSYHVILAAAALLAVTGWAFAQAADEGAADPAAGDTGLDATAPAPAELTPEERAQLIQYLKDARPKRLAMERDQVASDLREGALFEPDPNVIDNAVKALTANPKNTWEDNADRICKAFAQVDPRFGAAYKQLVAGEFEKAAAAIKPLISERDTSYLAAAKRYCYAQAKRLAGEQAAAAEPRKQLLEDAVDAYTDLIKVMPDRFSFSAQALLNAAKAYELMSRKFYAMTLYKHWAESFGLLDPDMEKELRAKAEAIAADYKDPLGTLSKKMSDVQKLLVSVESGKPTQTKEREIVDMLNDLIATAQDQQQQQSQSQSQKPGEKKEGEKQEGQGQGQGQGQGPKKPGPPGGTQITPSQGAALSKLVEGEVLRPTNLRDIRNSASDATDEWGKLTPVEQQKMMETFRQSMPERYRQHLGDYYQKVNSTAGKNP